MSSVCLALISQYEYKSTVYVYAYVCACVYILNAVVGDTSKQFKLKNVGIINPK